MAEMVADRTACDHEEDSMMRHRLAMLAADSAGKVPRLKKVDAHALPWLVDLEHDLKSRKGKMVKMVGDGTPYEDDEDSVIQSLLVMLAADSAHVGHISGSFTQTIQRPFSQAIQGLKMRRLKHGPTTDSSWTKLDKKSGLLVGNTHLVIRGASPLDIIAYLMDPDGRHQQSKRNRESEVRLEIREARNVHCAVLFYEVKMPPFRNRTFLNIVVWKKLSETQYVWCVSPIANHGSVTPSDESHAVRAEGARCMRFTVLARGVTNVEYACTLDLKGHFPTWLTNSQIIPSLMELPYDLQEYFAQIRPLGDCTAQDGAFIGHMLMNTALKASKRRRAGPLRASFRARQSYGRHRSPTSTLWSLG
jgi:hypothetical protein